MVEILPLYFLLWLGLITRKEAENLLQEQQDGTFLVRLSERIWGYAISYKARDKCKHYLVNSTQNYCFLGNNQIEHKTLGKFLFWPRNKVCDNFLNKIVM